MSSSRSSNRRSRQGSSRPSISNSRLRCCTACGKLFTAAGTESKCRPDCPGLVTHQLYKTEASSHSSTDTPVERKCSYCKKRFWGNGKIKFCTTKCFEACSPEPFADSTSAASGAGASAEMGPPSHPLTNITGQPTCTWCGEGVSPGESFCNPDCYRNHEDIQRYYQQPVTNYRSTRSGAGASAYTRTLSQPSTSSVNSAYSQQQPYAHNTPNYYGTEASFQVETPYYLHRSGQRPCKVCHEPFTATPTKRIYCGDTCRIIDFQQRS